MNCEKCENLAPIETPLCNCWLLEEEEFVQTGNGTVAQRLRDLEEEE